MAGFWDWLWGAPETFVSSSSYNLAGEGEGRVQYLKVLTFQGIMSADRKKSMTDHLTNGYLRGPGIRFRSFFRWADNNYSAIGLPTGTLTGQASVNMQTVALHIPHGVGESIWAQDGDTGAADYSRWIEQWFLLNYPAEINTAWTADISGTTITITRAAGAGTHSFTATGFSKNAKYIYAYYSIVTGETPDALITGATIDMDPYDPFPSTSGYVLVNTTYELLPFEHTVEQYSKEDYSGEYTLPDGSKGTKKTITYLYLYKDTEHIPANEENSYRYDTQIIYLSNYSTLRLFIYRIGSGVAVLDNSVQILEYYGKFFPIMPLRIFNKFLSPSYLPDGYNLVKKGYKKLTGGKVDELIESLADNPDIADIDHAYIVLGVSLNTKEKSELKYLYRFFQKLMLSQSGGPLIYSNWVAERDAAQAQSATYALWKAAQADPGNPLYGTPAPPNTSVPVPLPTVNELRINNSGPVNTNYDIRINWFFVGELAGAGLGKPSAKKGDFWISFTGYDTFDSVINDTGGVYSGGTAQVEKIRIYNQTSISSYTYLDIVGLVHRNYIYDGKYVQILTKEALDDPRESGFILPLHYATLKEMSIVDSTQMSLTCVHLVFNAYEVVTHEWWESGFFQIIIVVVVAIASVVLTGGAGIGLLGANLAVGTAVGFTGITAAIVGSVANALAAMILVSVITNAAVAIFGEKLGAIIAVVVSFLVMQSAQAFHNTGSFSLNWGDLMKADNLMMVMDAAGQGYTAYVKGDIQRMGIESEELINDANSDLDQIRQQYFDEFGYGISIIDPMTLTNSSRIILESGDTFLTRTLMTGGDIADMSMNMLTDFASLTLKLPDAYS